MHAQQSTFHACIETCNHVNGHDCNTQMLYDSSYALYILISLAPLYTIMMLLVPWCIIMFCKSLYMLLDMHAGTSIAGCHDYKYLTGCMA